MKNFTTRFLFIGLMFILCTATNSYAQKVGHAPQQKPAQKEPGQKKSVQQPQIQETQSYTGHLVRITPKLADIDRTSMYGKPFIKTRDEDGVIGIGRNLEETEERLEEKFQKRSGKKTEGIQNPNTIFPNVPGTSLGTNFDGQQSPGLSPTDNNMAVGPNHIIQTVNDVNGTAFTIWNKSGTIVQGRTLLASITGFPGFGDPVVLYDQLADRWVLMEFGPNTLPIHTLNIAVSVTGNPTGAWKIYQYVDVTFFIDYEKMSVWHNAYYLTSNDFNNAGNAYIGSSVYSMDRAAMIAGAPTAVMIRTRLTDAGNNYYNMGTIGLEGMTPSTQNGLFAYPVQPNILNVFEVTPNFGAGTQIVGPNTAIPINAYAPPPGTVPQQGGGSAGTLGERMMFKLNYRKNGSTESIVMTHTVANGGLAAVRWYELRRVASVWTVFQQGTITGSDGNSRFMGGISMDACGNIALMYDVSGTTSFPSIKYTGRNASDPLNTMTLPEATIINGTVGHTANTRWGDYNTTVQDYSAVGNPNNGSFWSTSQYGNQSTRIANFTLTGGCAPAPNISAAGATLISESCVPANGVIDPGETVTVSFCLQNTGGLNTTNAVGTLLVSGGVISPSAPQNYGVIVAGGPPVCRNFTFTNSSATCGDIITASIQVQDGANNLGTITYPFTLGTTVIASTQNFDAVVAPALPAGWVATNLAGPAPLWVTSSAGTPAPPAFSAPNALFVDDPGVVSDKQIVTPSFIPGSGARVTFKNNFSTETFWDGGVLEISINGGAYVDITSLAGGSFVAGGYTLTLNTSGNPLGGRMAWSGSSGGFITTTANLPTAAAGQTVRLKFRMGSDGSVGAIGWRVDDFSVSQPACCGAVCTITCPANITTVNTPGLCGANVTYPAATTTGLCGPVTYSRASGSFFPLGTTTVTASTAAGPSCSFTVTVTDNQPPTITCPANISVPNTPGLCSAVVTYAAPVVIDNCPLPGTPITLTQSTNNTTITPGSGVACPPGDNHFWRAYSLALSAPLTINSVRFGVEQNTTAQVVTVKLYTSAGAFPGGTRTLVGSQTVNITNASGVFYTATFTSPPTVAANAIVAVEIDAATGGMFPGANGLGESAPSYISSATCGVPTPVTFASIGFNATHLIIDIAGSVQNPAASLTQIAGLPSGSVFPVGVTTNTFRATDAAGNTATCSFTVTVNDAEQPNITCPANQTRNTDAGLCYATYTPPQPTFTDNCGVTKLTWTMSGATTGTSGATGINYVPSTQFGLTGTTGVGVTTITYTATDAAGNTRTCTFTVTVNDASIPVITTPLTNQTVCVGSNAAFTIGANAGAGNPLTYQWEGFNGTIWVPIAGATSATLTLNNVTFSMNTNSYRVVLTGRCSVVISNFATLYVNRLPSITLAASRIPILLPGESVNLVATVDPTGGTYQWFKNGILVPGQTGATYTGLTVDNIGTYTVRYTDLNGCVSVSNAITISGAPSGNLYVFPNPNFGQFSIRFFNQVGDPATITVFDAKGARVFQRQMVTTTAYTRLDVDLGPTSSSGVYIVEVRNSTGQLMGSKKVIVRHQ